MLYTRAFKFPKSVVAFCSCICVSKPEPFYWKLCLVSKETAVFTPYIVILIAVTTIAGVCTCLVHSACALTTVARWCSTPVPLLFRITWDPPSCSTSEELWFITLILDKLLAVWGDMGEIGQLRQSGSNVLNFPGVASTLSTSVYQSPALCIVTDDCDANSVLLYHVTVNCEWFQISLAIWINAVISTCCCRAFLL